MRKLNGETAMSHALAKPPVDYKPAPARGSLTPRAARCLKRTLVTKFCEGQMPAAVVKIFFLVFPELKGA